MQHLFHALWRMRLGLLLVLGCVGCASQAAPPPVEAPPRGEDRSPVLNLVAEKEAKLQHWKETAGQLRKSLEQTRTELERSQASGLKLRKQRDTLAAQESLLRESLQTVAMERRELLEGLAEQQLSGLRRERAALEDQLIRLEAFGDDLYTDHEPIFEGEEEPVAPEENGHSNPSEASHGSGH